MGHDHHHHAHENQRGLKVAFFLNLIFTIIEFIGGWYVNSVAIVSDAVHDLGDSLALGMAWWLERKSQAKPNKQYTFGYARFSLLGALINGIILIIGSIFVIVEAIERIQAPEMPDATGMIYFAVLGIAVNGYAAWKLMDNRSLNVKMVSWHLVEDVMGWVMVLVAAIVLSFYEIPILDAALSLVITLYILWNVVQRLRETIRIFLQRSPDDINIPEIEHAIVNVEHVASVHHTHVWSLEGQQHVFTTHIKLQHINSFQQLLLVKNTVKSILANYPFEHYTIETELDKETCGLANH